MGFIGTMLKTLFNPSVPQVQTPQITGRDLISETSSQEPEAPVMGGSDKSRKRNGINSLLVPSNDLYKGGM